MVFKHMAKFNLSVVVVAILSAVFADGSYSQTGQKKLPGVEARAPQVSQTSNPLRLRFITDNDYPPFNYLDENGNLTGFNVELAKVICAELKVRCSVQALAWERMITAIENDAADAIIASLAITKKNRRRVSFSRQYYQTPARFVTRKSDGYKDMTPEILRGKRIGVARNTSHEAYLKAFFKGSIVQSFVTPDTARQALVEGQVDAVFGDGVSLMFWINGIASNKCCEYSGGPFSEAKFFGEGVGIAVKKNNLQMLKVINNGLDRVQKSGKYQQLFQKYFPASFY
jgi:polar amino acid transport system substrate-binding protein